MSRYDPIETSSPAAPQPFRDFSDSEDDLAKLDMDNFVTQPTMPVNGTRSAHFAPTQPTQPLTPRAHRVHDPSQIQVLRSSPAANRVSSPVISQPHTQRPFRNPMAPPGTFVFAPQPVARPMVDLTSDDPPVEPDSDEEGDFTSNIKPSAIELNSGTSRVQETPQKRSFNASEYTYDANRKRPADDYASSNRPPMKMPRHIAPQSRPARAMPVEYQTLDDIPDYSMQKTVERVQMVYPMLSVQRLYDAVLRKRGNYSDALNLLAEEMESELLKPTPGVALPRVRAEPFIAPKRTAMRALNAPTKSIHEKYTNIRQSQPTPATPEPPKRRRKLMQGRRNPSPHAPTSPEGEKTKDILSDGEDEAIVISDDESEAEQSDEVHVDETKLLKYFNECSIEAMVDLSNQKEEDVRAILAHRPWTSLRQVEKIHLDAPAAKDGAAKKKSRRPKVPFGERLVDSATTMWKGYEAVDQLVKKCETRGKPMAIAMANWGIDIFGAATDGEVALTSLDDISDTNSTRDSGIGTPRSGHGSDIETESLRKGLTSNKTALLKKPANMAPDIELKDYQVVGLNWLNLLWVNGISGILADDMGLGKTCQVITLLSHLKEQNVPGPHLIVVPGSTLENWLREFKRFSPDMAVEPYYGSQNSRMEHQEIILDTIKSIDVIVTTYDLAFKPKDNQFLRKCRPASCIYDEGHVLRNSNTQRYKSLMKIPAKMRLLLTGTPLQNSLRELASILAFLMPDIFREVEQDLEVVFKHKAKVNESDSHGALLSTQRIQRARSMMTPFVLRRKKVQVLKHLPKKTCRVEYCELTDTQKKLYTAQLEKQKQVLIDRAAGISSTDHTNVMMKLRQAAIHPLLFRSRYDETRIRKMSKACLKEPMFYESNPNVIYEELELYQDYQCHSLALKYPKALHQFQLKNDEWMDSGKVQKLVELLKKFKANGDRTLIFSQFTSVMDILQWVLDTLDMSYFRLDGSTAIATRQDMLDQFYEDESIPVFMLSTKSGGAGINLACANKVIIFDSSFNPQDDVQAENRAHRVGQTREVEVVRLVTKGTVEEQIHALGVSKLELDKMVSGEDAEPGAPAKKGAETKLSAAEEMGLEAVEQMMLAGLKNEKKGDVKDQFLEGLKAKGLDMSAA
jgi:SWI/SNF-related matrix-associated actin-dependent regulator 1 of chromatin subfamily A